MNDSKIKKLDNEKIAHTYGRFDVAIVEGDGARCIDAEGNKYIDFTSGIGVNSLGFCDDGWIGAVTEQLNTLQHVSNLYYTEPQVRVADYLTEATHFEKVSFANSGAEANEAAIKVARKYGNTVLGEGKNKIITLRDSFHGRTMATLTATGQDKYHKYFDPFLDGFVYCDANDLEGVKAAADEETCAILVEIVQGEGGVNNLDEDFVVGVCELCREKDILFMVDEIQTGIGRTGKLFAYQHYNVKPDVVTFAKGIAGGLPMGGALYGRRCCDIFQPGDHGTTFGANPVCCAAASYVLSCMDDEFLAAVAEKGEYMRDKISQMDHVKALHGMGLMIGIELEGETKNGKPLKAIDVVNRGLDSGLMALTAGDRVRLLPPLNITYEEIDEGLEILANVLKA
jgi:acetylornithine/N-succinyldiaminopimelate aminotransferase